jgi:hypothetical protein
MRYQSIETAYAQNERLKKEISKLTLEVMDKGTAIMNLSLNNNNARDRIKVLESEVAYWKEEAKAKDQAMAEICGRNHALSERVNVIEVFLKNKASHAYDCGMFANEDWSSPCDCGLSDALEVKQHLPGDDPSDQCPCPACEGIRREGKCQE